MHMTFIIIWQSQDDMQSHADSHDSHRMMHNHMTITYRMTHVNHLVITGWCDHELHICMIHISHDRYRMALIITWRLTWQSHDDSHNHMRVTWWLTMGGESIDALMFKRLLHDWTTCTEKSWRGEQVQVKERGAKCASEGEGGKGCKWRRGGAKGAMMVSYEPSILSKSGNMLT